MKKPAKRKRPKMRRLYVRPFRKLRHPINGSPFLYIRWKGDGWFLVKQLAEHVLNVTYSALKFRIWCALQDIPGNTRAEWKSFCRCVPLRKKAIKEQIRMAGVDATTDIEERMYVVDMQTTRFILRSYDKQSNGKMFSLFEAILELCYGPPDNIYKISVNGNPLAPLNYKTSNVDHDEEQPSQVTPMPMVDFEKEYFECECGRYYALSVDNGNVNYLGGGGGDDDDNNDGNLTPSSSSAYSTLLGLKYGNNNNNNRTNKKRRRQTGPSSSEKLWILAHQGYKCNICKTPIGTTTTTTNNGTTSTAIGPKSNCSQVNFHSNENESIDCGFNAASNPVIPFDIDHKIELSKGGSNDVAINMQALCLNCHRLKSIESVQSPFSEINHMCNKE